MTDETPPVDALREALDVLWGALEIDQLVELAEDCPAVIELCRLNHEQLAHVEEGES